MAEPGGTLLAAVRDWLEQERSIRSAVLFGSSARAETTPVTRDRWSDLDLHVITTRPAQLEQTDWAAVLPDQGYLGQAVRPATGGVRKATVLFAHGQLDLVLVPAAQMRLARWGWRLGLARRHARLREALNEIHTCICHGYRPLKGEAEWGGFYAAIQRDLPGVRLDDAAVCALADTALIEQHWVRQKLARGELIAAQHRLHLALADTNLRLLRELRLRRGEPVPSFGLGRHAESLLSPEELAWVTVDARCEREELAAATGRMLAGLEALTGRLTPDWRVPAALRHVLDAMLKPGP